MLRSNFGGAKISPIKLGRVLHSRQPQNIGLQENAKEV
jgi:hypothetical protein